MKGETVLDLEQEYSDNFFKKRIKLGWRGKILNPLIVELFQPETLVDVGCGIGDFVKWFQDNGVEAVGIEGTKNPLPYLAIDPEFFHVKDLREDLSGYFQNKFDLALCIEVAEHIEQEYSQILVENLCLLSDQIIFTAALPGQKGHGHINCQPQMFWEELFKKCRYEREEQTENLITSNLNYRDNVWVNTIITNLMIFKRRG